jgi:hypothetical protein
VPKPEDSESKRFPNPNEFLLPQAENISTATTTSNQPINGISPSTQSDNTLFMPPPPSQQLIMPPPPVPIDELKEKQQQRQFMPEQKQDSFSSLMEAMPPQNPTQFITTQYSTPISSQQQSTPLPINTSAYQPFLAYGAPPSGEQFSSFQQSNQFYRQAQNQQVYRGNQQQEMRQQHFSQENQSIPPIQPFFTSLFFNFIFIISSISFNEWWC